MTRRQRLAAAELCSAMASCDETSSGLRWTDVWPAFCGEDRPIREIAADAWRFALAEYYRLDQRSRGAQRERWALAASMLLTGEIK